MIQLDFSTIGIRLKPPFSYYGGKQKMVADILPLLPDSEFYCEPFCGGASIFWAKKLAKLNVINDVNLGLITLYKVLSTEQGIEELISMLEKTCFARYYHKLARYIYKNPDGHSDLEIAWSSFVLLTGFCHNHHMVGPYAISKDPEGGVRNSVFYNSVDRLKTFKDQYTKSLKQTSIELDDALRIIKRYDSVHAFFYCDPPYPSTHLGHYGGYSIDDFNDLLRLLERIKGKFMLSCFMNDQLKAFIDKNNYVSKCFIKNCSAFDAKAKNGQTKSEWVVMNYNPGLQQTTLF